MYVVISFLRVSFQLCPQKHSPPNSKSTHGQFLGPCMGRERKGKEKKKRRKSKKFNVMRPPPQAINALNLLKNSTPAHILAAPSPTQRRLSHSNPDATSSQIIDRGNTFFDKVYGKVSKRVMGGMRNSYDDLGVVAELMYGHVFSNLEVLGARDTSLLLVAGLIPQNVNPQLKGHLKGALNNGATVEEVMAVREMVLRICERAGWGGRESEVAKL